jgi:hemerythrin-like domain-containing protein
LLEFKDLIPWIYAPDDDFLTKRIKAITAREKLVSMIATGELDYKDIKEIIDYNEAVDSYNIEQLSAKILFDLTRNTGFEVSKGSIGECWINSCCKWQNRMKDDVCGLDNGRLSIDEKMKQIYKGTCLVTQLQNVGLEVAV